jgi:hypothetical protein
MIVNSTVFSPEWNEPRPTSPTVRTEVNSSGVEPGSCENTVWPFTIAERKPLSVETWSPLIWAVVASNPVRSTVVLNT